MTRINYQLKLDELIKKLEQENRVPRLLMHSCCGPCSSYVIEYLSNYFDMTIFYFNPNIYPDEEYRLRVQEQKRFIERFPTKYPVSFIEGDYDKERFYEMAKGHEEDRERGERCHSCYRMRLSETAKLASESGFDYFGTTLTISPQKDSMVLNEIGEELAAQYGVSWLPSDFKKREGYKRSTEISREYDMYRQDYCGCVYSYRDRQQQKREMEDK